MRCAIFIKPFDRLLKEFQTRESLEYIGDVLDNNDPLMLGRLKVKISIFEDIHKEQLPWSTPTPGAFLGNSKNSLAFSVPEIGSQVKVYFPTKDIYHPFWKGAELTQDNLCTFFQENYPNTYGFKDSNGNFFKVDKQSKTLQVQHSSSSNVIFNEDGSCKVTLNNGISLEMTADKKIIMNCDIMEINATTAVNINTPEVNASGQVSDYKSNLDVIRGIYNSHIHNTPLGPTSAPLEDM